VTKHQLPVATKAYSFVSSLFHISPKRTYSSNVIKKNSEIIERIFKFQTSDIKRNIISTKLFRNHANRWMWRHCTLS